MKMSLAKERWYKDSGVPTQSWTKCKLGDDGNREEMQEPANERIVQYARAIAIAQEKLVVISRC